MKKLSGDNYHAQARSATARLVKQIFIPHLRSARVAKIQACYKVICEVRS